MKLDSSGIIGRALARLKAGLLASLLASLLAGLTACSNDGSDTSPRTGTLSVSLTDAPIDNLQSVVVTFTGLVVQSTNGKRTEIVFPKAKTLNLLELQNGVTEPLVEGAELAAGTYSWIRLDLSEEPGSMYVIDNLGGQYSLKVPSGAQTGLKLLRGFTVLANGQSDFTIDFDVRKSVKLTGQSLSTGDFILRPTLRLVDNAQAGAVGGLIDGFAVQAQCENEQLFSGVVYVFEGHNASVEDFDAETSGALVAVPVADSNNDGTYNYQATFLPAGDYTVAYTCDADDMTLDENLGFSEAVNTAVTAGASTTVNF